MATLKNEPTERKPMEIKPYEPGMELSGFISGMPNDVYHSTPGFTSKSGLDIINISPAHFKFGASKPATKAMNLGSAIHSAILEPELFAKDYLLLREVQDRRVSAYKDAAKNFPAERILTAPEVDLVSGMQESLTMNPKARYWLDKPGQSEVSLFTKCPAAGLNVRVRFDRITDDGYVIDLKSTKSADPEEFSKAIYNFRYHVQDAIYSDAYEWHTGEKLKGFVFLAVESDVPHVSMPYELDDISKSIGRAEYRKNLETLAECLRTGNWPAYPTVGDEAELISLPEWAILRHEAENDSDVVTL
jgi:hypothetical protein